jgi:hypothetical protein
MKDIQLRKNTNGNGYDWNFNHFDVETVEREQAVVNSVIHNIMLHNNELLQDTYADKGCSVYDHLPLISSTKSKDMLTEIIRTSILETNGVREAKVELNIKYGELEITDLQITLENGKEVRINGI